MSEAAAFDGRRGLWLAVALSLAAAVSLGVARFAYALLLPPMRADLGWNYLVAGSLNTANAFGYLLGALAGARLLQRFGAGRVVLGGSAATAALLLACALTASTPLLLALRLATGAASALVFVGGGLLAARLASAAPQGGGLRLALYYGGTGFGIVFSALAVPAAEAAVAAWSGGGARLGWQAAWALLGVGCALATGAMRAPVRRLDAAQAAAGAAQGGADFGWRPLGCGLAAYFLFGTGYIGYMTFVVALLREQGLAPGAITAFYALLGAGVVASPLLWARLLQRHRDGRPIALLNGLLALACALPALAAHPLLAMASGLAFGAVFLQVPGATTALVRHNLAPAHWGAGIGAFTVVFAAGQVVGPLWTGWVSDSAGGLARGLLWSAAALALGAAVGTRQRALSA